MVANDSHRATGDFRSIPVSVNRTKHTHTSTMITAPSVLIGLREVDQMRERRRQLEALRAWAASRQSSELTR
jgi:hypothetical protein